MASLRLRFLTRLLTFLMAAPLLAAASIQGSFERTLQVTGPVELQAYTRSGDITVRNGPAGTVTIRGKIQVSDRWLGGDWQSQVKEIEKNPPIQQTGNSIRIESVDLRRISIDYEITVPADTTVQTRTGSGDQRIEGLSGKLTLESGSGDLRLREISSEIRAHTGSGDIEARDISGAFTAETGSGDIRLDEKSSGDVRVSTGSGTVELRNIKGALEAHSGSGDIGINGVQTGTWEIRTGSGNVQLELPPQASFDLEASTTSGEVIVDRAVTMVVQGEVSENRHRINGKVGNGGPRLTVHTGSGDVHIH